MTECNDEIDNDEDELIDLNDPGCVDPDSIAELNDPALPTPACYDGEDNDGDGEIDYPNDPVVPSGDVEEWKLCQGTTDVHISYGERVTIDGTTLPGNGEYLGTCARSQPSGQIVALVIEETSSLIAELTGGTNALSIRDTICDDQDAEVACDKSSDQAPQSS